ncbi:hypothetical protein DFH07DRAFT_502156 [Mycena maculata]|uniref:Secreted protein n=1 Tax=Mycena maculata TaxID=230809 RepID=A0AAD7J3K4_9AGAR|nr:hypothetical protein DFH07DRAFT_502156 [Mycena maculata]
MLNSSLSLTIIMVVHIFQSISEPRNDQLTSAATKPPVSFNSLVLAIPSSHPMPVSFTVASHKANPIRMDPLGSTPRHLLAAAWYQTAGDIRAAAPICPDKVETTPFAPPLVGGYSIARKCRYDSLVLCFALLIAIRR